MKISNSILQKKICAALFMIFSLFNFSVVSAQYFGRNKVNYHKLQFQVLESPHFELYNYLKSTSVKTRFIQNAEQWYQMHQAVFADTFKEKNPFILYNTHADFQQTNAIDELIGVGTGGVTEALKNRVILPFMEFNAQTDHVTGHELVHAFQYHLVRNSDSLSIRSLENLPTWMVEGLAEYMSTGIKDPLTALWLRSAAIDNRLPSLKDLTNKPDQYFPYRWGEAFWAYVTGIWGDNIIRPLFLATAKEGYKDALKKVLGIDEKLFSQKWKEAIINAYGPLQKTSSITGVGRELVNRHNAGKMNIVPSISPDGKLMAFWTEKDIFNIDLYLADAQTGKIIRKLTSHSFSSHIDEYSSFESSVAWSPDSKQVAFVAFSNGRNRLLIVDENGKLKREIDIPDVAGFSNPSWSPDGKRIAMTGLVDGQSDLYLYDLETKQVTRLTQDRFADLSPSWSPDGKWIVFATDRLSIGNKSVQHSYWHNLAFYNLNTGEVRTLDFFEGANNLNPVFAGDGHTVYFISDRDGLRNLYSVDISTGQLFQLTNFYTGISGITLFSPAISVSQQTGEIVYNYYAPNGDYVIFSAHDRDFAKTSVTDKPADLHAAMLPPFDRAGKNIVQANIENAPYSLVAENSLVNKPYKPKLQLEYLSNSGGIGVTTGGSFSPGVAGGVNGIFTDILGNHQLYGAVAINGEVYDFGGQFAYFNQNQRINWGASVSHLPYITGYQQISPDSLIINNDTFGVVNLSTDILRTFQDQASLFTAYPFSQTRRLEAGASFARYYYRLDRYSDFYTPDGYYITSERHRLPTPKGFNFGQVYLAYVGDNSQFGVASPLTGHRYRFEAGQYFGIANLQSLLADYRKYFRMAPFTFAVRNMYVARFGRDAESGILPPMYLGDPYYIRGYQALDFATEKNNGGVTINDLLGSKIFVSNAELRLPFTGPERLSLIRSRIFFSELNLFTDGGIAWGNPGIPGSNIKAGFTPRASKVILSSGVSLRVNLFGYVIVEPYYAIPWQNDGFRNMSFGFNFIPGW